MSVVIESDFVSANNDTFNKASFWRTLSNALVMSRKSNNESEFSMEKQKEITSKECLVIKNNFFLLYGHNQDLMNETSKIISSKTSHAFLKEHDLFLEGYLLSAKILIYYTLIRMKSISKHLLEPERFEHIVINTVEEIDGEYDGGTQCCYAYHPSQRNMKENEQKRGYKSPVLIILPGLGQSQDSYTNVIENCVEKRGWSVVVINRRGLCESLRSPQFYVSGRDIDNCQMLRMLHAKPEFQNRPFFAVGNSLGGLLLNRYLGNYCTDSDRKLDGIISGGSISSPTHPRDLVILDPLVHPALTKTMKTIWINPYQHIKPKLSDLSIDILLTPQQAQEEEKELIRVTSLRVKLSQTNNIFEFMLLNLLMCPNNQKNTQWQELLTTHGSVNITNMVRKNDPRIWECFQKENPTINSEKINIPFLVINSRDDPLIRLRPESSSSLLKCPNILYMSLKSGGHCYFRSNMFSIEGPNWAEEVLFNFFEMILKKHPEFLVNHTTQV